MNNKKMFISLLLFISFGMTLIALMIYLSYILQNGLIISPVSWDMIILCITIAGLCTQIKIIYNHLTQNQCKICEKILDDPDFPDDFPKKYKICCDCLRIAKYIYMDNQEHNYTTYGVLKLNIIKKSIEWEWAEERYEKYKKEFDNLFKIKN